MLLLLTVALPHDCLAGFIRAYRHESSKSPVYQKRQVHVEEENLERKVIEEKRTKKFYYAVRAPSDSGSMLGPKGKESGPYGGISNDIALDMDFSGGDYSPYKSQSKFRDRGRDDVIFQGRNTRTEYENDFSELPPVRSTTVSPYLIIRPEALREKNVPEDYAEQATQLYETFRKPQKGFRPSPLLEFTDSSMASNFVPTHGPVRFPTEAYGSSRSTPPVIFHNEIHASGGRKFMTNIYNDFDSPAVQHSSFSSYGSTMDQPEKGQTGSVFHNSIHASSPVNDYLQMELLKALQDNKALLQHQRQQEQQRQRANFLLSYPQHAQRMLPQSFPMRSPAMQTPYANMVNNLNFRRYPFMRRQGEEKSKNLLSPDGWRRPISGGHQRRVKRSPLIPKGKQSFPISFSIPILPSKSNISVPPYAIVDTELVNVGDFDSNDYVFDKLLDIDFPTSHSPWLHQSIPPNIFHDTAVRWNTSQHSLKEVLHEKPHDSEPKPPLETLVSTIQQASEALANKEAGEGHHEQPILFALNPTKASEEDERATRPTLDQIEEFGQHSAPNGSYSIWYVPKIDLNCHSQEISAKQFYFRFTSEGGIDFKEKGYVKSTEKSGESSALGAGANVKVGSVSWTSPEGFAFTLTYEADEHGYRPKLTQITPRRLLQPAENPKVEQQSQGAATPQNLNQPQESVFRPS